MSRKPPKQVRHDIALLAAKMPVIVDWTKETGFYTAKELIEKGYEEVDSEKIDPDAHYCPKCESEKTYKQPGKCPVCKTPLKEAMYKVDEPVQLSRNHFRRMCKAYMQGGVQAVLKYAQEVNDFIIKQRQNESVT